MAMGWAREGNAICCSRDPYSSGVPFDYAQGRLSTPFGCRLTTQDDSASDSGGCTRRLGINIPV